MDLQEGQSGKDVPHAMDGRGGQDSFLMALAAIWATATTIATAALFMAQNDGTHRNDKHNQYNAANQKVGPVILQEGKHRKRSFRKSGNWGKPSPGNPGDGRIEGFLPGGPSLASRPRVCPAAAGNAQLYGGD